MEKRSGTLENLLCGQRQLLAELFGAETYQIEGSAGEVVKLRTDWVVISLAYDWRDQWVSSMVTPLRVPSDLSEEWPADTLLRFCGVDVDVRRKSQLDDQQIIDELTLIRPIVGLLQDEQTSRDVTWFARGYSAAYTDWASGEFG